MTSVRFPSASRGDDHSPGVRTSHGFAFGGHPGPTSLGAMVLHDEHLLAPGAGFPPHDHRELEIVTWVLEGLLEHRGLADRSLGPGSVQHLTAGTGVRHAEQAGDLPTRFVQCWLLPSEPGRAPGYVADQRPLGGGLTQVLDLPEGQLHVARLEPGDVVDLPQAPYAHVFQARGRTDLLEAGDALHLQGEAVRLIASTPAELLVWVMLEVPWHPDERNP